MWTPSARRLPTRSFQLGAPTRLDELRALFIRGRPKGCMPVGKAAGIQPFGVRAYLESVVSNAPPMISATPSAL